MEETKNKFVNNYIYTTKPLYYISRFLVLNPYKFIDGAMQKLSRADHIYGYMQALVTAVLVVSSFIVKMLSSYLKHSTHVTTITLEIVTSCIQTILIILSIRSNITKNIYHMVVFFSDIQIISNNIGFSAKNNYSGTQTKMLVKCLVVIFGTVIIAALDIWVSLNVDRYEAAFYNIYHYWLSFYEFVIFLEIETKIDLLKQMYQHMNQLMIKNSLEFNPDIDFQAANWSLQKNKFNIHQTAKTHYLLGELIVIINKTHGVQIVAIICSLILSILNLLNKGIIVVQDKSTAMSGFKYGGVMVQLMWCLCFLIIGIIISSRCSVTLRYANDTKVIAQKLLLQDRPLLNGNDNDNDVFKHQLEMLSDSGDIPLFSAAGFFKVDFTLIYEVMGAVTTYFIVLLQFASVTN